jgi:twitching motility protein PilT
MMQTNRKVGMVLMNDALMEVVEKKLVEPKEAWMKSVDKGAFEAALKAKGHDMGFLKNVEQ